MSDAVKVALIAAATALIALTLNIYFSPFHTCVREGNYNPVAGAHGFSR